MKLNLNDIRVPRFRRAQEEYSFEVHSERVPAPGATVGARSTARVAPLRLSSRQPPLLALGADVKRVGGGKQ